MRILAVMGKLALVAVALVLLAGCCAEQDKQVRTLTIMNRDLGQRMNEKDAELARLQERIQSFETNATNFNTVLAGKNDMIKNLQDQIQSLQTNLDKRNQEYQDLVNKMANMGPGRVGRIDIRVVQLLKALQEKYPELFAFDEESQRLRFGADVTFDLGSDEVKPRAAEAIARLAAILNDEAAKPILIDIVGHTCNTPIVRAETLAKYKTNQDLSEGRAQSVKSLLAQGGIADSRITTKGLGETQPLVPNTTKENKAKNRRVEIFLRTP